MAGLKQIFNQQVDLSKVHAARISDDARKALSDAQVRRATPEEMADWVEGFLKKGGKADRLLDHQMFDDVFVARHDAFIPGLYGACALSLIVPEDVTLTSHYRDCGHSRIYRMADFSTSDSYFMMPSDVAKVLRKRGYSKADMLEGLVATGKIKPPPPPVVPVETHYDGDSKQITTLQNNIKPLRKISLKRAS